MREEKGAVEEEKRARKRRAKKKEAWEKGAWEKEAVEKHKPWIYDHMNEERTMQNGQRARIIGGTRSRVSIQFENGTVVTNKAYCNFVSGEILNKDETWIDAHIGDEITLLIGMKARIIGGTRSDMLVQFEDGATTHCKHFDKYIKHPTLRSSLKRDEKVAKGSTLGTFNVAKIAFTKYLERDIYEVYYECECQLCGYSDILTPQEMIEHKCEKHEQ